ncbi:MAG: FecR domain-containing protein [Opitutae bacterium]|nr:FecR domain-containing protein [Opitutae bacterium]
MSRLLFTVAIFSTLVHLGRAEDATALPWYVSKHTQLVNALLEKKKAVAQARAALAQSEQAVAKAIELKDSAALPVAEKAVEVSRQALNQAEKSFAATNSDEAAYRRALAWNLQGKDWALATTIKGAVTVKKAGANGVTTPETFDGSTPVRNGDLIKTGDDGLVRLHFPDGTQLQIGPNSVFETQFSDKGTVHKLLEGVLRAKHRRTVIAPAAVLGSNDTSYRTPTVAVAVRGTAFTLEVDAHGYTRFTPDSGLVDLRPTGLPTKSFPGAWWSDTPPSAPASGGILSVLSAQGMVSWAATAHDTPAQHVQTGDSRSSGTVVTGEKAAARLRLDNGAICDLDAETAFATVTPAGQPLLYQVKSGRVRLYRQPPLPNEAVGKISVFIGNGMLTFDYGECLIETTGRKTSVVIPLTGVQSVVGAHEDSPDSPD